MPYPFDGLDDLDGNKPQFAPAYAPQPEPPPEIVPRFGSPASNPAIRERVDAAQQQSADRATRQFRADQRVRAEDLAQRGIAYYSNPGGAVSPVTSSDGSLVTDYNKGSNVGYDGAGNPVKLKYGQTGPPAVVDAFAGLPPTTDPKTGDQYQIARGLPYKWLGKDPQVTGAIEQKQREKAVADVATSLGRKLSLDERQNVHDTHDLEKTWKDIGEQFGITKDDPNLEARKQIAESFNNEVDGYGSPQATAKQGFYGKDYTPEALQYRSELDAKKDSAVRAYDSAFEKHVGQKEARAEIEYRRKIQSQVEQRRLDAAVQKAQSAGAVIPGLEPESAPSEQRADIIPGIPFDSSPEWKPRPEPPPQQPVAAKPDAPFTADESPFRASDSGITFDPKRLVAGITAARDAGAIEPDKFNDLLPKAQAAENAAKEQEKLLANDTVASKLKALGVGAGKGAAFLAGAPAGAGIGAEIGAFGGPIAEFTVPAGAAIGGLITGSAAAWGADKVLKKLAEHSDTIKSFTDAAEAHPYYDAAGNLVAFGAGLPKAGMQAVGKGIQSLAGEGTSIAAKAGRVIARGYETGGGGLADTVKNLAEDASIRSASGASAGTVAGALAARVGGYAAGSAAIDTVIKEGSKALGFSDEGQTLPGAAQAALIGAFISGHGIRTEGRTPLDMADVILRAKLRENSGMSLTEGVVPPDKMPPGVDNLSQAPLSRPLSAKDVEVLNRWNAEVTRLQAEGKVAASPSPDEIRDIASRSTARQSLQNDQPYGVTSVEIAPRSEAAQAGAYSQPSQPTSPTLALPGGVPTSEFRPNSPAPFPVEQSQRPPSAESDGLAPREAQGELKQTASPFVTPQNEFVQGKKQEEGEGSGQDRSGADSPESNLLAERDQLLQSTQRTPSSQIDAAMLQAEKGRLAEVESELAQTLPAPAAPQNSAPTPDGRPSLIPGLEPEPSASAPISPLRPPASVSGDITPQRPLAPRQRESVIPGIAEDGSVMERPSTAQAGQPALIVRREDFTPRGQVAIDKLQALIEQPENKRLLSNLGVTGMTFKRMAANKSGISEIDAEARQLAVDGDRLHSQLARLADGGASTKVWMQHAIDEAVIHFAQFKIPNWKQVHADVWNDPDLPQGLRDAARKSYEGFDALPDHAKGAEAVRMVAQGRWKGTITERIFKALQDVVAYLRGLDLKAHPSLRAAVEKVEQILGEAGGRVRAKATAPGEPGKRTFKRKIPEAPGGYDAIEGLIANIGKIKHPETARRQQLAKDGKTPFQRTTNLGGEWDGWMNMPPMLRKLVFDPKSRITPDEAAQAAYEQHIIASPSPDALLDELKGAWQTRLNAQKGEKLAAKGERITAAKTEAFEKAANNSKGGNELSTDDLAVGDSVQVGTEVMKVIAVDAESGDVTLQDGNKFGIQQVEGGDVIYGQIVDEPGDYGEQVFASRAKRNEPGQRDMLEESGQQPFNLAGEKGNDGFRVQSELDQQRADAEEAKRNRDRDQGTLFASAKKQASQEADSLAASAYISPKAKELMESEAQRSYLAEMRDPAKLAERFRNPNGVTVLNADDIIGASPAMKAANHDDGINIAWDMYADAAALRDSAFEHLLKQPSQKGGYVLFTAGGMGSGKSTSVRGAATADFVYDSVLGDAKAAIAKIREVLATGRRVRVEFTEREVGDSMRGNIHRAADVKRLVTADKLAAGNVNARSAIKETAQAYTGNGRVDFSVYRIDDAGRRSVSLSEIKPLDLDQAKAEAHSAINAIANGTDPKWKGPFPRPEVLQRGRGVLGESGRGGGSSEPQVERSGSGSAAARRTAAQADSGELSASAIGEAFRKQVDAVANEVAAVKAAHKNAPISDRIKAGYDATGNLANIEGERAMNSIRLDFIKSPAPGETRADRARREAKNKNDLVAARLVVEAGGNKAELLKDRAKIETAKAGPLQIKWLRYIDHAIANFDSLNARLDGHTKLANDAYDALIAAGEDFGKRENFVHRVTRPEDEERVNGIFAMGSGQSSSPKGMEKGRVFNKIADALAANYDPGSYGIHEADQRMVENAQRIIGGKAFLEEMRKTVSSTDGKPVIGQWDMVKKASGKTEQQVPLGYKIVTAQGAPIIVHEAFAPIFKDLYGTSALRNHAMWRGLMKMEAIAKHGTLVLDTFHVGRLLFKMAVGGGGMPFTLRFGSPVFNYHKGLSLLEYADADLDRAVKNEEISYEDAGFARRNRPRFNKLVEHGLNIGKVSDNLLEQADMHVPGLSKVNDWIFRKLSRGAMAQTALKFLDRNLANKGLTEEQAYRQTAKEMNEYFGNLQNQGLFQDKTLQDVARLVFLAPNWTESQFRYEGRAYTQAGKSAYNAARGRGFTVGNGTRAFASGFVALLAVNQLINFMSRKQPTFQNEEEHHKFDAWIPGGRRGFWFSPLEIAGEFAHAYEKYRANHENPVDAISHIATNKLSPIARGVKEAVSGRDAMGRHFLSDADRFRGALTDALPSPLPLGSVLEKDPRAPLGYRATRTPGAIQKQLMQSVGAKVTPAQSPRTQMFAIAQPFRADGGKSDSAGEYTALRQALDNQDDDSARTEINWLTKDRGKDIEQIGRALGIKKSGEISPEKFTGGEDRENAMLAKLTPVERKVYTQAQLDHVANARRFQSITRTMALRPATKPASPKPQIPMFTGFH